MAATQQQDRALKPVIALAMGDPAGISPELTAKILADTEARSAATYMVVGDRRVLAEGEKTARVALDIPAWHLGDNQLDLSKGAVFVDLRHLDPGDIERGQATRAGGRFALTNFRTALRLAASGAADAVTFTPFNKFAMRQALPTYDDEIAVITEETGGTLHGREFNILGDLWNARITSHVPLRAVADLLTTDKIVEGIELTARCMVEAGYSNPRIAVAGINPHAGDNGNFGREEIEIIEPAVAEAKARGIHAEGPFPSDTVFLRAQRGDFDAVQTMYHDQGQIAMKMMGFDRGITLIGGYSFPVCTPAHGTAYDIAGRGEANIGATRNAMLIAARMAKAGSMSASDRAAALSRVVASLDLTPA
ncbi:MAG: 4-hydroxythreonine-4-phosphate dehydrogenase PdxA [Hyphomicrobiaceae bacterium]|nr:4-hydroxythreonine-4-phosphate dehydrogenase PdxA [Hyphomicrobiaceae bacterium]